MKYWKLTALAMTAITASSPAQNAGNHNPAFSVPNTFIGGEPYIFIGEDDGEVFEPRTPVGLQLRNPPGQDEPYNGSTTLQWSSSSGGVLAFDGELSMTGFKDEDRTGDGDTGGSWTWTRDNQANFHDDTVYLQGSASAEPGAVTLESFHSKDPDDKFTKDFTLLKVDLDIVHPATGELSEEREDADTNSGIVAIKRDDETPVTQLKIHAADSLPAGSKVKLLFVNGSGEGTRYRIWKNADFTDEVSSSTTELDATIEHTLFIEGLKKSIGGESSEKITQIYDVGSTSFEGDSVRFTVVEAEFDVWLNVFIPIQWTDIPLNPVHFDVVDAPGNPTVVFNRKIAKGDDRDFTTIFFDDPASDVDDVAAGTASRAHMQLTVIPFSELDADGIKDGTFIKEIGRSFNYDKSESVPNPGETYSDNNRLNENPVITSQATEPGTGLDDPKDTIAWVDSNQRSVRFKLKGGTPNPLVPLAPAIDWDFDIGILVDGVNITNPEWKIYGNKQDGFPAYELYVRDSDGDSGNERGTTIYQYDPFDFGRTPIELFDGWWWGVIDETVLIDEGEIQ